ncbi:endonuclease MutS2, partial [candidate division GN15 bacterium]|nr:endonuclease MutS2 [candidate division GN15 bacterium]
LITGPNTGGKTVALKTVGLMVLMAQTGLPIPAGDKSMVGVFPQVYADIGDEQSIELSLSTFSSHMKNIIHAVEQVTGDTLVLLDEIGAGPDPKEGAALAESIILHLVEQGARLLSSTHYSQLKTLALDHSEIENASLEFDRKTLAPTYRLQMGIPGSSYAVEIAGRLGMPEDICKHATTLLGTSERSLGELISSLENELKQVREDKADLTERLDKARRLEEYYKAQTAKLESEVEERRTEALKETEDLLEESRRELERMVAEIRRTQAEGKRVKDAHKYLRDTSDRVKELRRKDRQKTDKSQPVDPTRFSKGDRVRIISLDREGEVTEVLSGDRARVRVGAVNTVVELRNLERLQQPGGKQPTRPTAATPDVSDISPEIHLRGMTAEEGILALEQFLDRAVVAGLSQVYVVHGKGTGALRRALTEYLKGSREVDSIRLGNWNEGGAGVTIVKLKT